MKKPYVESRIYFTEKDIYDALMSSKRTMTMPIILELARDRGILLSPDDSREDLIKYLSSLVYDYYDLNVLIDHMTPSHQKERSKVTKIDTKFNNADLKIACNDIKDENITIQVTKDSENPQKTTIKFEYNEVDLSKTRLRQTVRRESTVEIIEEDGKTKIRKPFNDKVDAMMKNIISHIEEKTESTIIEEKINLYGFTFIQKTEYFTKLINNIENCKLDDVIKVTVNNEENPDTEEDFINMITNASFKGKGLLATPEYQKLKDGGYYISSIVWQSKETAKDGNKIEFEASIISSKECEELSFLPKGVYRYDSIKKNYTITRRPLKKEENEKYTNIIEKVAFHTYSEIVNELES